MAARRSSKKIAAIYDLREAAEAKANAQAAVAAQPTATTRDALLDAQIELEAKTMDAVEACHDCDEPGHDHDGGGSGPPQNRGIASARDNVIAVDFGRDAASA